MKKMLWFFVFGLFFGQVFAQAVVEAPAVNIVGSSGGYYPYNRYFYISINEKFLLGDRVEAQVCGSGIATLEVYRFEDLSVLIKRMSAYSSSQPEELLKNEKPLKVVTVQLGMGEECKKADLQISQGGLYFVKGYSTESEQKPTAFFSVEEIALMVKSGKQKKVFFAVDAKSGKPLSGVEIFLIEAKNSWFEEKPEIIEKSIGFTNNTGLLEWQSEKPKQNYSLQMFIAKKGSSLAFVTDYTYWYEQEQKALYLFTDRPIYRPNQRVFFKGILWNTGIQKSAVEGEKIEIKIRDSKYAEVFRETYTTGALGSFEGSFLLGEEPPLGYYYVEARKGEQYLGSASFQVQEYRKPEFEVKVNPSKEVFVGGERARVEIKAEYFFKAPVQNAKTMYRVYSSYYQSPCYGYWRCAYYELQETGYYDSYYPPYYYGRNLIIESETITDSEGKAFIEFDTNADREKRYYIEATVVDESNRQVNGSGQIIVAPALFRLTVMPDKWWYAENEKARITVSLNDFEGNPVNAEASVKIFKLNWNIDLKKYDQTIVKQETLVANEGKAEFFAVLPAGEYLIEATAVDAKGNTVKGQNSFSVSSQAIESKIQELQASLDRDIYLAGESAIVTIKMPEAPFYALVSVEGTDLFSYETVYSEKNSLSYQVDITENHQPNAFAYITGVQGGKVFTKSLRLNVPPKEKKIDLSIQTNSQYYKPGEKAKYTIKATSQGQPIETEIAIMIVDEAIYQLAKDNKQDIFKFFFKPEYNQVTTQWNLGGYYYDYHARKTLGGEGPMPTPSAPPIMEEAQKVSGEKQYAQAEVRKTFADTAYWNAFLKTDSQGIAELEVPLPDNLTTWRATAIANSKTKAGASENKIAVTKNLIARLIMPKFAVKGDEFTVKAIVHNSLPEMKTALVKIEADNLEFPEGNEMEITIATGKSETAEFKAIAKKCCSAKIKLQALTDTESDALEITIPVLPWGVKEFETISGEAGQKTTLDIVIPENTDREADKIIINLNPTLAGTIIDSLEYLTGYPYGCVEQTMSRFLPDVVVAQTLKDLGLKNEKLETELPDMVEKGLQKLYSMQSSDGGWGWWYNDSSQPYMTAYVMYGLTLAKKAGFKVRETEFEKGLKALKEKFPNATYSHYYYTENSYKTEKDRELQAFISYVLYLNGDTRFVKEVKDSKNELSDYGKALLLLQLDSKEEATPILEELSKSASCDPVFCSWKGKTWRAYWSEKDMETTAMVLKALVKWTPENEKTRKAINWLLSKKQYNRWRSTQDTATTVMALADFLKYSGELEPNYTAKLYINNELKKEFSVTKENLFNAIEKTEIKMPEKQTQVRIEVEGKGKLYYSITKEYFSKQEKIPAKSNGITIKRTMENTIKTGQETKITLSITADREYDYVVIEDFLPAGTIAVDSRQRNNYGYYYWDWHPYWYSQIEFRDQKTVFFFNYLKQGTTEVTYTIRGEVPGTYQHLPAQAHAMYNPEINGYSEGNTFTITTEKAFSLPKIEVHPHYIWIYPHPIPLKETIKTTILDSTGKEIITTTTQPQNGKIEVPLPKELANGTYSVKVSTENTKTTKEFQVGKVEIKKADLSSTNYFNDLLERTIQPKTANPAQTFCTNTGGTWNNGKCNCPKGKNWLFGIGCIASETIQTPIPPLPPKPVEINTALLALTAILICYIILAFVFFMKSKPVTQEKTTTEKTQQKTAKESRWKFKEK
ncbi:MAG: MG2 domain-containing protein [Candidatus Diapherotrites archaeon]